MTIITFEYAHTFGALLTCVFLVIIIRTLLNFKKSFKTVKVLTKKNDHTYNSHINDPNDPFVMSFRKTRTEMIIISKIEELQKTRDIQVVVSFLNYKDNKSVKGSIYIVTSKIVYKIIFIKYNPVLTIYHNLKNFAGFNNNSYKSIYEYLDKNKNCEKQKHHDEFFTWSHYFFTNNYENESILWKEFIESM